MLVSFKYDFTFICVPKTASTSIEDALKRYCDIITENDAYVKHTAAKNYEDYFSQFEQFINWRKKRLEKVCVMREPLSHLISWYKFRQRDQLKDPNHPKHKYYIKNITLDTFLTGFTLEERPIYCQEILPQSHFFCDNKNNIIVDRIFQFEKLNEVEDFFKKKINPKIKFDFLNVSKTKKVNTSVDEELQEKLKNVFKLDYEIYESLQNN